jgi:hypothetical protein
MNIPAPARAAGSPAHDAQDLLRLALILSFSCTGLDQFLRTPPAQFSAQPGGQAEHWVTASLLTLPLFAAGVWAGDWIASRAGLGVARRADIIKRALIIALLAAVALIPVWFEASKVDGLARMQALITPGSHGSPDVYWVSPAVIAALPCVCLAPAAAWAGRGIAARIRLARGAGTVARGAVTVTLLAAVPVLAWLLHQAAQHAYASQVSYTSASASVPVQPHAIARRAPGTRFPAGPPVTAAPFAVAYQAAHALQDGLAGQAAGFPVIAVSLLRAARRPSDPVPHQQSVTRGGAS